MNPDPTAVELAREGLPLWVTWGSAALVVLASVFVALANSWVGAAFMRRSLRGLAADSWPERARLVFAAKQAAATSCLASTVLCAAFGICFAGPFSVVSPRGLAILGAGVALTVGMWRYRCFAQRLRARPIPLGRALRGVATCSLLFGAPFLALIPGLILTPTDWGGDALAVAAVTALTILALACGGGFRLARFLGLARPASPRTLAIAAAASERAALAPRAVYELSWPMANAVAFPLTQSVAFTDGALEQIGDADLQAICAHELGHLKETRRTVLARVAVALSCAPVVLIVPLFATYGIGGVVPVAVWVLTVAQVWGRTSRRLEAAADESACHDTGGEAYARALERMHEVNLLPVVLSSRGGTHPHLYDRMLAAGIQPSYPRPDPPPRAMVRSALVASLLVGAVLVLGTPISLVALVCGKGGDLVRIQASLLLPTRNVAPRLAALAEGRHGAGDGDAAVKLYRAAAGIERDTWSAAAHLAMAFVLSGRCEQARASLSAARTSFCGEGCGPMDGPPAALAAETAVLKCGARLPPPRPPY